MGKRLHRLWLRLKNWLFWGVVIFVFWVAKSVYFNHYEQGVEDRARNVIYPLIQETTWSGVEQYLRVGGVHTLIFVYDSSGLLSRWYFDGMNRIAGELAPYGVRAVFVSVDENTLDLAKYLASKGDLYFTPLHMPESDTAYVRDVITRAGGSFKPGALPYMGVMDQVMFLRSFSPAIVRTGSVREALIQNLNAKR